MRSIRQMLELIASVFFLWSLLGCAAEALLSPPPPGDSRYGTAGNVLISDRGRSNDSVIDQIWVGFDSQAAFQNFLVLNQKYANGGFWIGGKVVAQAELPLDFYFDPGTTSAAEVTAEGMQTTLDQIKANPTEFAKNPLGRWVVPATVEGIVPAGP